MIPKRSKENKDYSYRTLVNTTEEVLSEGYFPNDLICDGEKVNIDDFLTIITKNGFEICQVINTNPFTIEIIEIKNVLCLDNIK